MASTLTAGLAAYLLAFGGATLACVWGLSRASTIQDPDTRRGMAGLLATAAVWAGATVVYLAAPARSVAVAAHLIGLVAGVAAVGAWLYFCSAYTGRSLHRRPDVRRVALGTFVLVALLKVTNPIHGLYFAVRTVDAPFAHVAVEYGLLHWLTMGATYALAFVGYFMLVELFLEVDADARPLMALVALTGTPVVLDVVGFASDLLVDVPYEPLGVAAFAVGVLTVYRSEFRAVQLTGQGGEPALVLARDDRIRDFDGDVRELFPDLSADDVGRSLVDALPRVAAALAADPPILELAVDDGRRYYRLTEHPFAAGGVGATGRVVRFADVTERERYRRRLERQNERLEEFAGIVSHDLRSPLSVASGQLELVRAERDDGRLDRAAAALDRMDELIGDLRDLTRQGQPIDETETVQLSTVAWESWQNVDAGAASFTIADEFAFRADPQRLKQLLENLFRNAVEHGGADVAVRAGATTDGEGFYVEDDGRGIDPADRDDVFESGFTTSDDGTGFGLSIVKGIADAHGWSTAVTESADGGARFEFRTRGA